MKTVAARRSGIVSFTSRARSSTKAPPTSRTTITIATRRTFSSSKSSAPRPIGFRSRGLACFRKARERRIPRVSISTAASRRTIGQRHRAVCHALSLGPAAGASGSLRRLEVARHVASLCGLCRICHRAHQRSRQVTSSRSMNAQGWFRPALARVSTRRGLRCRKRKSIRSVTTSRWAMVLRCRLSARTPEAGQKSVRPRISKSAFPPLKPRPISARRKSPRANSTPAT